MNAKQYSEKVRSVLEDGVLLFADEVETEPEGAEEILRLQLAFSGEKQGRLRLTCHRAIGEAIARNLLGLGDDDPCPPDLAESSAAELLNILGGSLLADLSDNKGSISMRTPLPDSDGFANGQAEKAAGKGPSHFLRSHWQIEGRPLSLSLEWSPG